MDTPSLLTRVDYEDYLIRLYFGTAADDLLLCLNRAYLDFCRTLHGLRQLESRQGLHAEALHMMRERFAAIPSDMPSFVNQAAFDRWHQDTWMALVTLYSGHGHILFIGQAQKWVNMTFKYIFTLGDRRLPDYTPIYPRCHVPLDNILIAELTRYDFPALERPWSRIGDYTEYLAYQMWFRERFNIAPLDVEFYVWLGRDVPLIAPK